MAKAQERLSELQALEADRERLVSALERRSTQLQTAAEVSKSASTILDPEELMSHAVNLIKERFGFYYVGIFLVDESGKYAVLRAGTGEAGRKMIEQGHRLTVGGESMIGWSVANAKARIALDVGQEAIRFDNPLLPQTRSEMALPLISRGRCIGGLTVQSTREAAFSESDIAVLQTMADQLAIAIDNARLYEAARREIARRKLAEAEIRKLNEELELRVAERTAQLRHAIEQFEAVLNSSSDAIVLVMPDGEILQSNPAFDAMFGRRVGSSIEQLMDALVEPKHKEAFARALISAIYDRERKRIEVAVMRDDGTAFDADVEFAPVTSCNGELGGVVLSLRDVTRIKEMDRFKTQFVDNAAHDLGNPIANLKLRLYMLKRSPERLHEHLAVLEGQVQRLERLVEDLRTLSRLGQGTVSLDLKPTDLNALVSAVVNEHVPLAVSKGQSLSFEPGNDIPPVLADGFQLERVIANLVSNALNYTPKGGTITVSTHCEGQMCACTVKDTGIGIPQEALPRIFERFYRGCRSQELGIDGTGLGLAIAQEIAEAHGGKIEVQSEVGRGSVFTLWVPACKADKGRPYAESSG